MPQQHPEEAPPIVCQTRGVNLYGDECFVVEFDQVVGQITDYRHGEVVSFRVDPKTRQVGYYLRGFLVFTSPRLYEPDEGVRHAAQRYAAAAKAGGDAGDDDFFDRAQVIDLS